MSLKRLIAGTALALLASSSAMAAPALWRVSDADSSIWLFGSVHLLKPGTDWRTQLFDDLLVTVDKVYFEADVGAESQAQIAPLTFEVGYYRDGTLLSQRLDDETMAQLREVASAFDLPVPLLLIMRPWMVATTLSVLGLTEDDYDPQLGVELVLGAEVEKARSFYLETPEEQIMMLSGGDESEEISMLKATLDSMDTMSADIERMVDAWLAGTPEQLGEEFMAQMGGYDESFVTRLIDERNANWAEQIEQMLEKNEEALLVVGAAHLIGDVSVVKMLEDKGFTSERVQ